MFRFMDTRPSVENNLENNIFSLTMVSHLNAENCSVWYTNNNFCSGHKSTKKVHTNWFIFHLICEKNTLCIFLYEKHVINKPINWEKLFKCPLSCKPCEVKNYVTCLLTKNHFSFCLFYVLIHWKKTRFVVDWNWLFNTFHLLVIFVYE